MPRYKLTIEYDGTNFSGWQIQPNALTVEEVLEKAFSEILQATIDLIGQGRTDAGVHARGQVAHVDLPDDIDPEKLIFGVNGKIGEAIYIKEIRQVAGDFHSRFDAVSREYVYTLATRPIPLMRNHCWPVRYDLDLQKLIECAKALIGEYDFAGFSKFNEDNYTTLCEILNSKIEVEGELIYFRISANRFLRNMVRRLVGTMADVASGRLAIEEFKNLLQHPDANVRTFTAPAKGLILEKVLYKNEH